MESPKIKELREAYNSGIKNEINKFSAVSYQQGFTNALFSVKKGLDIFIGKQVEPPITIEDIVKLVDCWLEGSKIKLEQVKKEQEW